MKAKLKWIILICATLALGIVVWFITTTGDNLKQQIVEMQGKRISLDFKNARSVINGKDSLFINVSKPKLIVFVDSTSCSSCFLGRLTNYYEINDSLNRHNGEMIVVLHPQKERITEIETRLNENKFPFWCIIDMNGEFHNQNPYIPENPLLHTFTIDGNDNIILIGDPIRNEKIEKLFFQHILKTK